MLESMFLMLKTKWPKVFVSRSHPSLIIRGFQKLKMEWVFPVIQETVLKSVLNRTIPIHAWRKDLFVKLKALKIDLFRW